MKTIYRFGIGDDVVVRRRFVDSYATNKTRYRQEFVDFLLNAVPIELVEDFVRELISRVSGATVKKRLDQVLDKWGGCTQSQPKAADWDDVGIGTTLLSKSSCSSMTNIDAVRRAARDDGIVPVYHLEGWGGWYTLDELKEKWWLVLPEEEKQ